MIVSIDAFAKLFYEMAWEDIRMLEYVFLYEDLPEQRKEELRKFARIKLKNSMTENKGHE